MNNCLIDQAIDKVIWKCKCYPLFGGMNFYHRIKSVISYCTGKGLYCENEIMKSLGQGFGIVEEEIPNKMENTPFMDKLLRPKPVKCLQNCFVQDMTKEKSHTNFPQQKLFMFTKDFCEVASHIWQVSCQDGSERKYFLNRSYPNLCIELGKFEDRFRSNTSCKVQLWTLLGVLGEIYRFS